MKWIWTIVSVYFIYYVILIVREKISVNEKKPGKVYSDIIDVSDMTDGEEFRGVDVGSKQKTQPTENVFAQPARKDVQRIFGAVYGQGFEISKYNSELVRNGQVQMSNIQALT